MLLEEVINTLENSNIEKVLELLSYLNDVFESYNKNIENFKEIVTILINYGINQSDSGIKDKVFDTLSRAAAFKDIDDIDLNLIENNLDNLPVKCLVSAISILGFSHKEKYLPILRKYCNHNDKYVISEASTAISEIEDYLAGL